jgi:hypothetical protein
MIHPEDVNADTLIEKVMTAMENGDRPIENARNEGTLNLGGARFLYEYFNNLITERARN